jgi:hypothetical protein
MARILAGAAAFVLLITGTILFWRGSPSESALPPAPAASTTRPSMLAAPPEASPKSREEKRFSRADKDKNGRIEREELLAPRRKAFAKLDKDGNGTLAFEEWAVRTVDKFAEADKDKSAWLTPAEYAATAPPPPKKKRCAC